MVRVERAETTEASVNDPKLVVAIPRQLVDVDVAGDMNSARKIARVVFSCGLQFRRHRRHVAVLPNGIGTADRQPVVVGGNAHRLRECSEVSIELAVVVSDDNRFAGLISGNDQADPKLVK